MPQNHALAPFFFALRVGTVNDRDEKETITQLKRELERMDDTFVPPVPQVFELNQRLARFKQERKRALKKEPCTMIKTAGT